MGDTVGYKFIKSRDKEKCLFVFIEGNDITFKYVEYSENYPTYNDLVIIPKNTNYNTFIGIESQLVRNKNKVLFKDIKGSDITFKKALEGFIEDLYVNQYFRECGDILGLKAALEHVPMLQGIIFRHLYKYFKNKLKNNLRNKNFDIQYKSHFEEIYISYSKFLTNPLNERLFLPGGWFVDESGKNSVDIDHILFKTENNFNNISGKTVNSWKNLHFENSPIIRTILKRYGVLDILNLSLPRFRISSLFTLSLFILTFFILADIIDYQLNPGKIVGSIFAWHNWIYWGLYISIIFFSVLTLIIAGCLTLWYKLRIVPGLFLPRMIIAIFSGWLVYLTGEELMKIDLKINGLILTFLAIGLVCITVLFMVFEINNYAPGMGWRRVIKRSILVCGLAFIVSYSFGFWIMTHVSEKYMAIDNFLIDQSELSKDYKKRKDDIEHSITTLDSYVNKLHTVRSKMVRDSILITPWKDILNFEIDTIAVLSRIDTSSHISSNREIRKLINDEIMQVKSIVKDTREILVKNNEKGKVLFDSLIYKINNLLLNNNKFDIFLNKSLNQLVLEHIANDPLFESNKTLYYTRSYQLNPFCNVNCIKVVAFPSMIFSRALIAMFIGIFLQLIIQDKSITEPI